MADMAGTRGRVEGLAPDYVVPEIDTTKPSVARVYDACLGGQDHYLVDAAVVDELRRVAPDCVDAGLVNRAFLVRGVRQLARLGVDQFLDLGCGLPTAQNTHEVAQAVNPDARVVYVDNDPIVVAHGEALLARNDATRVIRADMRDVDGVLHHPAVDGFLDLSRPVGLLMVAVVHHLPDEDDPRGMVAAYVDRLAPGSHLLLSHVCDSFVTASTVRQSLARAQDVLLRALGRGYVRSREQIASYLDGLELLEPGLTPLPHWRPEQPGCEPLSPSEQLLVGGLARKPA